MEESIAATLEKPAPSVASSATTTATSNTSKKDNIVKQAAIHNASKVVAAATKKAYERNITTPSAFAQFSKAFMEMQMIGLASKLVLLEELATMTDEEKMDCLFRVLDKNRDGSLSVVELADGMRKIQGDVGFEESLNIAMERVACFDTNGDAKLQFPEFQQYVLTLSEAFGATFHELAEMLILSVVFSDTGNDEIENSAAELASETITMALQEEEALIKVMEDDRMKVLFHMFDLDADGSVDFAEVVMGLYKITEDLDAATSTAVAALMIFDDDGNAEFDYAEFSRFIIEVISATGKTFDEAIFNITKSAAEDNPNYMTKLELIVLLRGLVGQ